MSQPIAWLLELEIVAGKDAGFRALMVEMVAATQANEPGALSYEWGVSPDGRQCHIYERYADSAALMTHLGTFGQRFAARFLEVLKPVRFVVYGSPDEAARQALAGLNPVYFDAAAGFTR